MYWIHFDWPTNWSLYETSANKICVNLRFFSFEILLFYLDYLWAVSHWIFFININPAKIHFKNNIPNQFKNNLKIFGLKKHHECCENIVSASCKSFILIYSNATIDEHVVAWPTNFRDSFFCVHFSIQ